MEGPAELGMEVPLVDAPVALADMDPSVDLSDTFGDASDIAFFAVRYADAVGAVAIGSSAGDELCLPGGKRALDVDDRVSTAGGKAVPYAELSERNQVITQSECHAALVSLGLVRIGELDDVSVRARVVGVERIAQFFAIVRCPKA